MKILIASSYHDAWNSVRPEAEIFIEMAALGHQLTIVTQGNAEYVTRFKKHGIKIIDCYPKGKICFKTIKTIRQELKTGNYDIVYAMNSKTIPNAAFACSGLPVKMVTYRGTEGGLYRHDPTAYLTHLHPRVDGIICVANAVRKNVQQRIWSNKLPVVTIYKGQETKWFNSTRADLSQLGIPLDAFVGICVANTRPSKGVSVLIEASKQLATNNKLHLLLVGRGLDCEPYTSLIADSPMKDRIHVAGYRNDVPALMAAANVQIQPSISGEGLPKTVIEAMALALPSIVTSTGGSKELVEDEETGYVVPVNNPSALANKISALYDDQQLAIIMGKKAKLRMQKSFSLKKSVEGHLAFFSTLLSKS